MSTSGKFGARKKDHPSLTIKLALEVDYLPGHEAWIQKPGRASSVGLFHWLGALYF